MHLIITTMRLQEIHDALKGSAQTLLLTDIHSVTERGESTNVLVKVVSVGPGGEETFPEREVVEARAKLAALVETGVVRGASQVLTPFNDTNYGEYATITAYEAGEPEDGVLPTVMVGVEVQDQDP